ncbi:MAG: exodeoxyribonuclease V subunit alpha [Proteobacteria bacterium]|nr:exodeoxyribonuclease V subunit alpha [Pseudomonadota bacterium]
MPDFAFELSRSFERLCGAQSDELNATLAKLCAALAAGHSCIKTAPLSSPLIGRPGEFKPLTQDKDRLYLTRYWWYESQLATRLRQLAGEKCDVDLAKLATLLDELFPASSIQPDLQKVAAAAAVMQKLTVISGGPGTGKTTTVLRILAALQIMEGNTLSIKMAAPTGKAAARMSESVRERKSSLAVTPATLAVIPETASTLHRLLGPRPDGSFKHHAANPLALDVLVVDEASMIDLALMAQLVEALPAHARLILLGDKDQLDAVDAGAVFAELCSLKSPSADFIQALKSATGVTIASSKAPASSVGNAVMNLEHSHRFAAGGGIGKLASLVNSGDAKGALALLQPNDLFAETETELGWQPNSKTLLSRCDQGYAAYWQAVLAGDVDAAFAAFDTFRVLTALREGHAGVMGVNQQLEAHWQAKKFIPENSLWYAGRPILITQNDYGVQLYNGDIGLAFIENGAPRVAFKGEGNTLRWFSPARLPAHETALALTVHKSQGSEFDEVILLLPDQPHELLSRSLIYTGLTRAKKKVEIWGSNDVLSKAIAKQSIRQSGLAAALR